jgi:TPR repeat protein
MTQTPRTLIESSRRWLKRTLIIAGLFFTILGTLPLASAATDDQRFAEALAAFDEAKGTQEAKHEGYQRAYIIWSELAEAGDTRANYHMGMMNMFGIGGATFDQLIGVQNIRIAAEGGYAIAQSFMGFLVERSDGTLVRAGDELAFSWWQKGAEGKHCAGVRRMVKVYTNGELGVAADPAKAAEWQALMETCNKR